MEDYGDRHYPHFEYERDPHYQNIERDDWSAFNKGIAIVALYMLFMTALILLVSYR